MERLDRAELAQLNWEHLHTFLAVARGGSFRAVQQNEGLAPNTVRRHIKALEKALGVVLFLRNPNGVELTNDGRKLLELAKKMEMQFLSIQRNIEPNADKLRGEVWISITEGLGTVWLMPRAVELQQKYTDLRLRIDCQMDAADLSRYKADFCVQLTMPDAQDLKVVKVGALHIMPFASKSYLDKHGRPQGLKDVGGHKFILQDAPQLQAMEYINEIADSELVVSNTAIVCNTSTAHYWAISRGGGIGILPTYVSMLSDHIEPVDIGDAFKIKRDIWLAFHPDVRQIKRIDMAIDWVKQIFDGDRYPWFRKDFIDPRELRDHIEDPQVQDMFGELLDPKRK